MKIATKFIFALAVILTIGFGTVQATTHVIMFQYPAYTPKTLSVQVGDTISWRPSTSAGFETHPLVFTNIPNGAVNVTGYTGASPFNYVVMVPGNYSFKCMNHGDCCGMTGTFAATASKVNSPWQANGFELFPNQPNPFAQETAIKFYLGHSGPVSIKIYDTRGIMVRDLLETEMGAGAHSVQMNRSGLPAGVYLYQLRSGDVTLSREMTLGASRE